MFGLPYGTYMPAYSGYAAPAAPLAPTTQLNSGLPMPASATMAVRPSYTPGAAAQSGPSAAVVGIVASQVPVTSVYVGKIPPAMPDTAVKKLLDLCGRVHKWARMSDPETGQMKKFGFCEFLQQESALRALRLLPQVAVDGSEKLMLNVDSKTRSALDEFQKRSIKQLDEGDDQILANMRKVVADAHTAAKDDEKKRKDGTTAGKGTVAAATSTALVTTPAGTVKLDDTDLKQAAWAKAQSVTDDIKGLVSEEISKFRAASGKRQEPPASVRLQEEKEKERERERELRKRKREERDGEKKDKKKDADDGKDKDKEKETDKAANGDGKASKDDKDKDKEEGEIKDDADSGRKRSRSRDRRRRSRDRRSDRDRHGRRDRSRDRDRRDRDRSRDRDRRRRSRSRDRSRRGSERERDRSDRRDRGRDRDRSRDKERERRDKDKDKERGSKNSKSRSRSPSARKSDAKDDKSNTVDKNQQLPAEVPAAPSEAAAIGQQTGSEQPSSTQLKGTGISLSLAPVAKKALAVKLSFKEQTDDDDQAAKKRVKLTPIDYSDDELRAAGMHLAPIPTNRELLYRYPIDWKTIDLFELINKNISPWVVQQITEYLGQVDNDLVAFIVKMVADHKPPAEIESELSAVLGADAEAMVIKMWTKLIELARAVGAAPR